MSGYPVLGDHGVGLVRILRGSSCLKTLVLVSGGPGVRRTMEDSKLIALCLGSGEVGIT